MKYIRAVLIGPILALALLSGVAGAQSYEGATLEDGIFFVPDNPTGGEEVNLAIAGLEPLVEVRVTLFDENNDEVDGLIAVAGTIAFRADANGEINVNFRLPEDLPDRAYTVLATSIRADGSTFETSWSFIIGPDANAGSQVTTDTGSSTTSGAADSSNGGALALTGASSRMTAVGGGILVLLGLGLVATAVASRRSDGVVT